VLLCVLIKVCGKRVFVVEFVGLGGGGGVKLGY